MAFVLQFIVVRTPLYSAKLVGEDGIFADLVINQPPGPDYLQVARIKGKEIYVPSQHPALIYETLELSGRIAKLVFDYSTLSEYNTTLFLRFLFSLFQLLIWIVYLLGAVIADERIQNPNTWFFLIGLLVLSLTPIAVYNSVDLQVDNTIGVLFVGMFCLALLLNHFGLIKERLFYIVLFVTSLLLGFGKNEWSVLFIFSMFATTTIRLVFSKFHFQVARLAPSQDHLIFGIALAGCLTGSLINYIYDPKNYDMGLQLMIQLSSTASVIGTLGLDRWLELSIRRLPYISIILLLLIFTFLRLVRTFRQLTYVQLLSFVFFASLLFSFLLSFKETGPRYFAPAFISGVATSMLVFPSLERRIQKLAFVVACLFLVFYSYLYYPQMAPFQSLQISSRPDCVQVLGVSDGYFRKDVDYVANSLGRKGEAALVAQYGKTLCDQ